MSNCHCNSGINLDGSGQFGRYLKALDPTYAPIDDRSIEDLLLFAKRYAGQIRFYDIPGNIIDDGIKPEKVSWREFFRRDMAVIASSIAVLNITNIKKEYDELRERLDENPSQDKFKALFSITIGLVARMDRWYTVAIPENPLRTDLDLAINSHLRWQMKRIMAYEDRYKSIDHKNPLNLDYSAIENDIVWGLNDAVDPFLAIFEGNNLNDQIRSAALIVDDIFNDFYSSLQNFIDKGPSYMSFALEQYPSHQPHMALFIAFLQIFKLAQEQMNGLTERMLDFYYKEVLQLTPKDSIPDKTHIIFELAKDISQYPLKAATSLSAGKDASGKEQIYKTETALVLNQAKVKELKTIFIEKDAVSSSDQTSKIKSIYARPVANSADGYGEPFAEVNPKWPTFGKGKTQLDKLNNICQFVDAAAESIITKNETQIGFSIASPQLVLQGGNRIIALKMDALKSEISNKDLEIWLSGEDGWLKISKKITAKNEIIKDLLSNGGDLSTGMPEESGYFFDTTETDGTLYICLPIVEKAVIAFDLALHPGRFYTTPYPVMQVLMGPEIDMDAEDFNELSIKNLSLSIRVGSINVPQQSTEFTLTGTVTDAESNKLKEVKVFVSAAVQTVTDANGNFSIATSVNKALMFQLAGHKTKIVFLTSTAPLNVTLQKGDGTEAMDSSMFRIPSFFDGLKQLTLQNDDGIILPNKPFDPFTAYPKFGSALYIGSNEVFNKPVDELAINIKHLADSTDAIFDINYFLFSKTDPEKLKDFEFFKLSLREQKQWTALSTFYGGNFMEGLLTLDVLYRKNSDGVVERLPSLKRTPLLYSSELKDNTIKGFLQLQNNIPPYLVDALIDALNKKPDTKDNSGGEIAATATQRDAFQRMAELAILLKVKEISLSYFTSLQRLDPEIDQFFHVYPFGMLETFNQPPAQSAIEGNNSNITLKNRAAAFAGIKRSSFNFQQLDAAKDYLLVNANQLLLPQFTFKSFYNKFDQQKNPAGIKAKFLAGYSDTSLEELYRKNVLNRMVLTASNTIQKFEGGNNQYSGNIQEEGMLFIGLEKAVPLQSVTLLFQFAEGSAEDEDNDPPVIHWSYLTNNEWRPMRGEDVVSDGTYGFQTTGIIKLNIPADATSNNTIITKELHWFCVSVTENANRIPNLVNVVAQAVVAVFEDNDNDQKHFDTSLPAGSISKLSVKVAEVSKVVQPFASFNGKHKEISKEFYTRVSERLRHKNRAINSWDYEHLVLDRFPSVYKVKCITATDPNCLCREGVAASGGKKLYTNFHFPANISEAERNKLFASVNVELQKNDKFLIEIVYYTAVKTELSAAVLKTLKTVLAQTFPNIDFSRFTFVNSTQGEVDSSDFNLYLSADVSCCGPQIAPGHVLLIPIANLKNRNSINPLQPKTSRRVLLEMEAYLKKLTSPFVKVHAKNPVYEQIIVGFRVQFYTGTDKGFYLKQLNDEIVHFLTPWAFDENAEVKFGQKIYASSIINFIEERSYVDFITDFAMGVCRDECCPETKMEKAKAGDPRTIEDALRVKTSFTTAVNGEIEEDVSNAASEDKSVAEILAGICGCDDLEKIIGQDADKKGEIVAIPSTARSILVSVPQHIIIPYTAPEIMTPCEKRKQEKSAANAQPTEAEAKPLSIFKEFTGTDIQAAKDETKIKMDTDPAVDKKMKTIVQVQDKTSEADKKNVDVAPAVLVSAPKDVSVSESETLNVKPAGISNTKPAKDALTKKNKPAAPAKTILKKADNGSKPSV